MHLVWQLVTARPPIHHEGANPAEALDFIFGGGAYAARDTSQHPKVVLLDLKLPKVDCLQVLRTIKADQRTKNIPVVVMTSLLENVVRERAKGYRAYLRKPFREAELMRVIGEILPRDKA